MRTFPGCTCALCRDPGFRAQVEADIQRIIQREQLLWIAEQQAADFAASPERQALERAWNAPAAEVYE